MRKMLLILGVVGLTILTGVSDAFAQRRSGGGGGGRSSSSSRSYSNGGRSYSNGGRSYYNGRGYAPGFSINVGRGYGYYGGLGYSPYYGGYDYAPSYYDNAPATNYVQPSIQQSFYPAPATAQQSVAMTVLLPAADAQVWFDNAATKQQGTERLFHSPMLDPNYNFTYTIKARWMENGQAVNRERRVNVQAGQNITVNFREDAREGIAPPLPMLPKTAPRN